MIAPAREPTTAGLRVALFLPSLGGGGAERVMVNLAGAFARRGITVDLVLVKANGPYLSQVPGSVRIIDLAAAKVATSLPALVRYLRRARPHALLSTLNTANVVAVLAKRLARVPTRTVVRQAVTLAPTAEGAASGLARFVPLLVRQFYPWADAIVAVSEGVAQDLSTAVRLPVTRIRIAPNPIVTPELFALAKEPLDHPWLASGTDPVVLAAGRLTAQKDFATLVHAFARVRARRACRLMILGEGPERPQLEELLSQLRLRDCAALPGFVQNPFAYMSRARVFVLSSAWEGLPGALIQALACGAAVVATDCPSGPREVLAGGRFGRLVPVGDVGALGDAIFATLDEPQRTPPAEAWNRYSEEAAVDRYLRILQGAPDE